VSQICEWIGCNACVVGWAQGTDLKVLSQSARNFPAIKRLDGTIPLPASIILVTVNGPG